MNMLSRFCLVFALAVGVLWAQSEMNVQQLVEFVRSSKALGFYSDKQIGAEVRKVKLTEKLTDKTIIDLQAQGIGPKTAEALKYLRDQTADMKPPTHDSTSSPATAAQPEPTNGGGSALSTQEAAPPAPSPSIQHAILESIRDYAQNYTKSLPNYFCVEVTRRYIDPNGGESFRNAGTIMAKLGYNEGQEKYNVYSIDGKLVDTTMDDVKVGGATSTGEFYSLMKTIFDPESQAEFNWDHWAKLRGRTMAVFNYFVDSAHSIWYLDARTEGQRIKTAYKGLIYADANTGEIDRIRFEAVDIPKSFPIRSTAETLDYDLVEISGQKFVLPLTAKLYMKDGRENSKNEIEFRAYRKFESDSFIKYDIGPNAPAPLPESKESPATGGDAGGKSTTSTQPTQDAPPPKPKRQPSPWVLPTTDDLPPPPPQ